MLGANFGMTKKQILAMRAGVYAIVNAKDGFIGADFSDVVNGKREEIPFRDAVAELVKMIEKEEKPKEKKK